MRTLNPRLFGNRAHLQLARGTADENVAYCSKEARNVFERGVRRENGKRGERSDLVALQTAINEGKSYDAVVDDHFEACAKYSRFVKEQIVRREQEATRERLVDELAQVTLRLWQASLDVCLQGIPHPREVMWYWDTSGNKGKSFYSRYASIHHNALILESGKKADLAYIFVQKPAPIVIFDLSRTTAPDPEQPKGPLDVIYSLMESLKNGYIVSTKYESRGLAFAVPHVVAFANFPPDQSKMSEDRWKIVNLNDIE